ncbi:RING-H2 finger protein ATL32-like [Spinacia oleracea]|uniref:RING-type E3 ubiquitin transferase n=1 Tax=Spinacia oleracea TaxID=3562 RepID=A0ABM3RPA8_SPIOL|nr:RING-H2 finger protein ATL32-like [Spinacia oleracea]
MCEKNCCNHTHHAIFFFFLLSLLLLLNASNINLFNHSTRPSHGAKAGENDAGSPSPPCGTTGTTKMVMAFLYGALFTLILTIVTNNSGLSSPKHNDERAAYSGAGPSDRTTFTRSIVDDDEVVEGGGVGVGFALLRTFPTFAYSVRRPPKMGKGSPFCVVCQSKFRDGELVRWLPECDHMFHLSCIDKWLTSHKTCPSCRDDLDITTTSHGSISNNGTISNEIYDYFNNEYNLYLG